MTDMEREQIIKALECCTFNPKCEECPIRGNDCINLSNLALGIIKELIEDNDNQSKTISSLLETIKDIKSDTVRKMQDRLKECLPYGFDGAYHKIVDHIAKEIKGGK